MLVNLLRRARCPATAEIVGVLIERAVLNLKIEVTVHAPCVLQLVILVAFDHESRGSHREAHICNGTIFVQHQLGTRRMVLEVGEERVLVSNQHPVILVVFMDASFAIRVAAGCDLAD